MNKIKWYNITCAHTKHIVPAQKYLFGKYTGFEPYYLDLGNNNIQKWGQDVADLLPDDDYIVFGLDDYLPIDYFDLNMFDKAMNAVMDYGLERFELGWGASKKKGFEEKGNLLLYGQTTPYKVSCQFSIWKTEALKRELRRTSTPWKFEVYGSCKAGCYKEPVFRWIEESALSGRQPNKINILGLRPSDVEELQKHNLIGTNLIYGWKGATEVPEDKGGKKYAQFYEV